MNGEGQRHPSARTQQSLQNVGNFAAQEGSQLDQHQRQPAAGAETKLQSGLDRHAAVVRADTPRLLHGLPPRFALRRRAGLDPVFAVRARCRYLSSADWTTAESSTGSCPFGVA
jgi:hypothetical protein